MRELTEYEKSKWLDEYNRFDAPEFIPTGCEPDEAYETVSQCTRMNDYGLSDWFVAAAVVEALDMYYYQIYGYYVEQFDDPEDLGLPSLKDFVAKATEMGLSGKRVPYYGEEISDDYRRLWDWAMEWRDEHEEETRDRLRIRRLREELERMEK